MITKILLFLLFLFLFNCAPRGLEEKTDDAVIDKNEILGKWDLTMYDINGVYPSWFEISEQDGDLTGVFVGRSGHARPADYVHFNGKEVYFSIRRLYEKPQEDLIFIGQVKEGNGVEVK